MLGISATIIGGKELKTKFDQSSKFIESALGKQLENLAAVVVQTAKQTVPYKTGGAGLSGSLTWNKPSKSGGVLEVHVGSNLPYAGYQERGRRLDGTHVVRHYTKPGTGKGFLKKGRDEAANQAKGKINVAISDIVENLAR